MSYTLYFDKWNQVEDYTNESFNTIASNDEAIINTEYFQYFLDENTTEEERQDPDFDLESIIESFRDSDSYWDFEQSFQPIYNYIHVLQEKSCEDRLLLIEKYVGNVVVVNVEAFDTEFLCLTGCGMDMSDYLELAYYIIDGVSPIKAREVLSLGTEAKALLNFCRETVEDTGSVGYYEITGFLEKGAA